IPDDSFDTGLKPDKLFVKWTAPASEGEPSMDYWTATQFYVSPGLTPFFYNVYSAILPEYLEKSKEERLAERDLTRLLQQDGVWLTGTDGELLKVSSSEEDITEQGLFTKQACIPWMGKTLPTVNVALYSLCEHYYIMLNLLQTIVPSGPQCMWDLADSPGVLTIHVYYVRTPWLILC
ncbi:Uncharacterized protein OBRU01_20911, partial [Operophtera brumata]